jgi:hypothetical protein
MNSRCEIMGSRYVKDLVLNIDQADVENAIQGYLRGNDFKLVSEKGEQYYKTGGIMLPLRGFKYCYQDGILHLEAWAGKIGKELNIGDGKFVGSAVKVPYYNSILNLMATLETVKLAYQRPNNQVQTPVQAQSDAQNQAPVYAQQPGAYSQATSAVFNEVNNANNRNAKIAFWLSIASLILMFASKFSLLVNIASYTLAIKYGLKSQKSGLAVAAIVINSIVIVITILIVFLS